LKKIDSKYSIYLEDAVYKEAAGKEIVLDQWITDMESNSMYIKSALEYSENQCSNMLVVLYIMAEQILSYDTIKRMVNVPEYLNIICKRMFVLLEHAHESYKSNSDLSDWYQINIEVVLDVVTLLTGKSVYDDMYCIKKMLFNVHKLTFINNTLPKAIKSAKDKLFALLEEGENNEKG